MDQVTFKANEVRTCLVLDATLVWVIVKNVMEQVSTTRKTDHAQSVIKEEGTGTTAVVVPIAIDYHHPNHYKGVRKGSGYKYHISNCLPY